MNSTTSGAAVDRRAEIEATLAHYPHLSEEHLAMLIRWFRKEASSLDVATIASNEAIAESYRRFRADHIDPITGRDVFRALAVVAVVAALVLVMVWRAL